MSKDQQAFPAAPNSWGEPVLGMTLRDYFAAKALPVAWDAYEEGYFDVGGHDGINEAIAECAYQMADAMLKAREQS